MTQAEHGKLLKKFAKSTSWWGRFFGSADAEEIHQIISELPPLELAVLDQRVRDSWTGYKFYNLNNWQTLQPSEVARLANSKFATSLLGLASFHFNGYVREAAIRELAKQHSGEELPFLLIRLNDWVVQVRALVAEIVRERMVPSYAQHFLSNISLVLRLRACGRVDKEFVDNICGLLKRPDCLELLRKGMLSGDKVIRRISFQLAAESGPVARSSIVRTLMNEPDAVVRSWAVRHLLPDVSADNLPTVAGPMLKDYFMPIRRDALWAFATKRPDLAAEPIRESLLDNSVSMRETARQFLKVAGIADARSFYIDKIQRGNSSQLFAAICGLGESGRSPDVALVHDFLKSSSTKLRRAAAYAVGRLDAEGNIPDLVVSLLDEKPSVSREATKALIPQARLVQLDELERLVVDAQQFHIRRNALTLVLHTSKWQKVPALLSACADPDPKLSALATRALLDWFATYNRSFAEPTRIDFEKIQSTLSKVGTVIPARRVKELKECLHLYFNEAD